MATVQDHYQNLLAEHYTWMLGDLAARREQVQQFFESHGLRGPGLAVDLGAGSGLQTLALALARQGYRVIAVDTSAPLLAELTERAAGLPVTAVCADLLTFRRHCAQPPELLVCMGDTLAHLESPERVRQLAAEAFAALQPAGALVLGFRDLSRALAGTDRIVPVRATEDRIVTCFLEYLPEHVQVHDVVYSRPGPGQAWTMHKSSYAKLRLSADQVAQWLADAGLHVRHAATQAGLVELIAVKR